MIVKEKEILDVKESHRPMRPKRPIGLHPYRFQDNPEEKRFADAWAAQNQTPRGTLAYLLLEANGDQHNPREPSDRDTVVAATVVQWLGSPVGQSFLADLGYIKQSTKAKSK